MHAEMAQEVTPATVTAFGVTGGQSGAAWKLVDLSD